MRVMDVARIRSGLQTSGHVVCLRMKICSISVVLLRGAMHEQKTEQARCLIQVDAACCTSSRVAAAQAPSGQSYLALRRNCMMMCSTWEGWAVASLLRLFKCARLAASRPCSSNAIKTVMTIVESKSVMLAPGDTQPRLSWVCTPVF